ncbi:ABC transporter permease [Lapillicoccus jejuensis]|uniref:ABC-2 type transport system permease protein n=1 Tax=Lapillicoccus jejuensis TaxID=402171 RepID=A0A542DYS1_9MICO|nr:ABC transporter permease [Lapillicoccus jejuensis]TQJ08196.1 ABC-2 type transport system permease protein [Lapillicoccus jejuensis]
MTAEPRTTSAPSPAAPGAPYGAPQDPGPRPPSAPWRVVAAREIHVKLTDKNFLVSTALTLALLAGSFALQVVLGQHRDSVTAVATGDGARTVLAAADRLGDEQGRPVDLTVTDATDPAAVTAAVRGGTADVGLVHDGTAWRLVSKDAADSSLTALVREAVQQQVLATNAAAAGTSVSALTAGSTLSLDRLDPGGDDAVKYVVALVFAFLFYLASLLFGMSIASSVVEEKQSRVVEILVSAVPVRQLLLGKVAGTSALALAQMVLFVGVGLVGVSMSSYRTLLPAVATASGWFLVFFLAGFVALACLWAAAGALATRNEDLQSTTPVLSMVLVITMVLGLVGQGTVQVVASFVPVLSVLAMPQRLFAGTAQWWEPVVSLGLTLAFVVLAVWVGERLYSRTLLQTQRRLSLREALRVRA